MKDILKDIIEHTLPTKSPIIKVSGTDTETNISSISEDRFVVTNAKLKTPLPELKGVFGISALSTLLSIVKTDDEYEEGSKIVITSEDKDGVSTPSTIYFKSKDGDFENTFRLVSKSFAEEAVPVMVFKGATWNVDFIPTNLGISRLKKQANIYKDEEVFSIFSENNSLIITFGLPSSHTGRFVFHTGVTGNLGKALNIPVQSFISVMDLVGDKRVYITSQGAIRVTLDSGLADYEYFIRPVK